LASQLCRELRSFFPDNAVELFISYYNHYRPESYKESTGTYFAKKSSINKDIDVLRHCATRSLVSRRDVVVVASVSCIYGIGLPEDYLAAAVQLSVGDTLPRDWIGRSLELSLLYTYGDQGDDSRFERGQYQVTTTTGRGTNDSEVLARTVTLWPPHEPFPMQVVLTSIHIEGNESLLRVTSIRHGMTNGFRDVKTTKIFPVRHLFKLAAVGVANRFRRSASNEFVSAYGLKAKHHVVPEGRLIQACESIQSELRDRLGELRVQGKNEAAHRLERRVSQDLQILRETGFCSGGENYSRHLAGRLPGEPPATLLDYFAMIDQGDWLLVMDESHVTLPQLKAMYAGDQSRKRMLVKHGYRLPSALDNRPLTYDEFWCKVKQAVFVSATPGKPEMNMCRSPPAEMIIRPTFVCDPRIHVRPTYGQLQDLLGEVRARTEKNQRTLAVALTKRDAEDLASFLLENEVKATYIHSGLKTKERSDALKALQSGEIDCLVGVNLLREGLDLPQVSLVAVFSACSEGFLRGESSLLQTIGRAARNVDGTAIFYANRITESMKRCMDDTARRRALQLEYNAKHGREMKSTAGSSTLSIFDILKERIDLEQQKHDQPRLSPSPSDLLEPHTMRKVIASPLSMNSVFPSYAIETDHLPSLPGVYFWKDQDGAVLYIGKTVNLRSRVKSYLATKSDHSLRIKAMIRKAQNVEFVVTPSERDALVLESKLIKHHQPHYNVLLKDDEHYPYICASVGDAYPRLSVAARREDASKKGCESRYRYFGPYTSFRELTTVLELVEDKYGLRAESFQARHGSGSKEAYQELFNRALREVFETNDSQKANELVKTRTVFESASQLFDSPYNRCRDVVVAAPIKRSADSVAVLVIQLRDGLVSGDYRYTCKVPCGISSDSDLAASIQTVLEKRHYPSALDLVAGEDFAWFPEEVLVSHELVEVLSTESVIASFRKEIERSGRNKRIKISTGARRGEKRIADERLLQFAVTNLQQLTNEKLSLDATGCVPNVVDAEKASKELAELLSLSRLPRRIECFDISHTQGLYPVGSRVVFIDGKPAPTLYRRFNVQSVVGVDDYASIEEVLERRFRRARVNGVVATKDSQDPWALPDLVVIDGGPGQLAAAIKGMSKAQILPSTEWISSSRMDIDQVCASSAGLTSRVDQAREASVAVCALAKGNEDLYVHGVTDPVNDEKDSPGLLLLRALRDESHRFALYSHQKRRSVVKSG
jgi:excinuclease ABC subunit B